MNSGFFPAPGRAPPNTPHTETHTETHTELVYFIHSI